MLAALVLALAPALQDSLPALPAPLAWLEDRGDDALVSRRLMLLEPGARAPRVLLEPLLWSFDAADRQALAWLGDRVAVTGPVASSRPAPNVALPLQLVTTRGAAHVTLAELEPEQMLPAPDGRALATLEPHRLSRVELSGGAPVARTLLSAADLGRSFLRGAVWAPDGGALHVSVDGRPDSMRGGVWRVALDGAAPVRVGDGSDPPFAVGAGGSLLAIARVERERYTPHELRRTWPGHQREPQVLARDLHWNLAAALNPADPSELAYVRTEDGALVLLDLAAEPPAARVLWRDATAADAPCWSSDGAWLAFSARDEERRSWVHALELATGAAHRLAPGLRPAFGPAWTSSGSGRLEEHGELAALHAARATDGGWRPTAAGSARPACVDGLPFTVEPRGRHLLLRRVDGPRAVRFLTFERGDEGQAYGVYGLHRAKREMLVDRPLSGEPIAWDDRDAAQALATLLVQAGLDASRAAELVDANAGSWLAAGLRVFFVMPLPFEQRLGALELPPTARALLIAVELEPEER